jgi:hypothetical protein
MGDIPSRLSWSVFVPESNTRLLVLTAALAFPLGGCGSMSSISVADLNPLKGSDPLRSADSNYFYKRDQVATGFVAASDLVGPDGRCAFDSVPRAAPAEAIAASPDIPVQAAEPMNPRSNQALYFTAGPQSGPAGAAPGALPPEVRGGPRGVALQMTECQVVGTIGYTDRVEIDANQRGERSVTLTYLSGDRPGVYRFRNGRLVSMERVAEAAPQKRSAKATKSKR